MRIAIPVAGGRLALHFGHCERFALIDADPAERRILGRQEVAPPPHAPGLLPRWLHEQGAEVVIAGGMGRRALDLFAQHGIEVILGARDGTPEELARAYLAGTLETGANVCDH